MSNGPIEIELTPPANDEIPFTPPPPDRSLRAETPPLEITTKKALCQMRAGTDNNIKQSFNFYSKI